MQTCRVRVLFAIELNSSVNEIRLQTNNERELKKKVQQMVQERTRQQLQHYASSGNLQLATGIIMSLL